MKIKTIEYSESHEYMTPTGLKRWRKSGMSAEIDESEDEFTCSIHLQEKVLKTLHKDNNPQIVEGGDDTFRRWAINEDGVTKVPVYPQPIPTLDRKAVDELEIKIDNAKTVGSMEELREDAYRYGLRIFFETKLQSLQS